MNRFIITDQTGCEVDVSYENMLKIVKGLSRRGETFSVRPVSED